MNIIINDLIKITRNVSPYNDYEERKIHIQYFIKRMQMSGYSPEERMEVYLRAKSKFDSMVKKDKDGEIPLYRPREWKRTERLKDKENKKRNWFKRGGYESVIFIDATPGSQLTRACQRVLNEIGLKIRVVEKSGPSLKRKLVKSNPFPTQPCKTGFCYLCESGSKVKCSKREVVYKIQCKTCKGKKGVYIGETSRSIKERLNEHYTKINNMDSSSVFIQHMKEEHGGLIQELEVKIISTHPTDPTSRQINEAVRIKEEKPDLNAKDEWGNSNAPRKTAESSVLL